MFNNKARRRKFRSNNKPFRRRHNGEGHRNKNLNSIINGQFRSGPIKGPYQIQKLIEKYTNLAKEALSTGDKILSENYLQHADHFSRINLTNNTTQDRSKSLDSGVGAETKRDETLPDKTEPLTENNTQEKIDKE